MYQTPELDIAKEFEDLLLTDTDCSPLKTLFIFKKMKRDARGNAKACNSCNSAGTKWVEGSSDCPYCEGLGYQWDEGKAYGWFYKKSVLSDRNLMSSTPAVVGTTIFNKQYLVVPKEIVLRQGDYILKLLLDNDNKPLIPIQLDDMYQVSESELNRSTSISSQFNTVTLQTDKRPLFRKILNATSK